MKTIAYNSPFIPAEWIAAHGLEPHWFRPQMIGAGSAAARGVCPYVGAMIDAAVSGIDASALVLTTVCDQMRYAAAVLETQCECPVFLMNVPSTWQTAAARRLYLDELRRLGRFLLRLDGTAPDRAELARTMLARRHVRCPACDGEVVADPAESLRLAILGGPLLHSDRALFETIAGTGGQVVLNATEGAERTVPRPFDPARIALDPLQELADAYFDGIPDAFRRPNTGLYEWLDGQLAARRVQGIIFWRHLWCDLWHAELLRVRQWSKLPVLEIDVGAEDTSLPNRTRGRIEAFIETLQ